MNKRFVQFLNELAEENDALDKRLIDEIRLNWDLRDIIKERECEIKKLKRAITSMKREQQIEKDFNQPK
jgi:hypothetical protein